MERPRIRYTYEVLTRSGIGSEAIESLLGDVHLAILSAEEKGASARMFALYTEDSRDHYAVVETDWGSSVGPV